MSYPLFSRTLVVCMTLALFGWFPIASAQKCPKATSAAGCKTGVVTANDKFVSCFPAASQFYKVYFAMAAMGDIKKLCAGAKAGGQQTPPNMTGPDGPEVKAAIAAQKVCAAKTTAADCSGDCVCNGDETCNLNPASLAALWKLKASDNLFSGMIGCQTTFDEKGCTALADCTWSKGDKTGNNPAQCAPDMKNSAKVCMGKTGAAVGTTAGAQETASGSAPMQGVALGLLAASMAILLH